MILKKYRIRYKYKFKRIKGNPEDCVCDYCENYYDCWEPMKNICIKLNTENTTPKFGYIDGR